MKYSQVLTGLILIGIFFFANAHDEMREHIPIDHLLQRYSEANETQFVLDPRVKARVNIVGLDMDNLSQSNIVDILLLHAFVAREKDGVVYVVPFTVVDTLEQKNFKVWGGDQ